MPVSRPTVRVFWADGPLVGWRSQHSAEGLVQRGAGQWVALSEVPNAAAQADAGAANFAGVPQERVVMLHDTLRETAPDVKALAAGVKETRFRNTRRDVSGFFMSRAEIEASGDLALFVRTGRSPSVECWRTFVEPGYREACRNTGPQSVAAQAAGGEHLPVRFPHR